MQIGIWGDSITYGGPTEGWVALLRKSISTDIELYNRGVCGDTSADILKRFSVEADAIEPSIVVIAVGANDSKFVSGSKINKVPNEQFEKNIRELITLAKARAKEVIIVGLTNVDEGTLNELIKSGDRSSIFLSAEMQRYDKSLRLIANEENLKFISMHNVLDVKSDLEDGIHPNLAGYSKMFAVAAPFFK